MLTLEQFRATKKYCEDLIEFTSEPGNKGWIYDDLCYIEGPMEDGNYYLVIGNCQHEGSLEQLEEILYKDFYIHEA